MTQPIAPCDVRVTRTARTALGIANASDAKENRETYTPTLRAGDGVVAAYGAQADDWEPIRRALEREIPAATVEPVEGLPEGGSDGSVSLRFRTAEHRNFLYSYGGSLGASVLVADRLPGLPGLDPDQGAVVDRVLTTGGVVVFANERVPGHEVVVSGRHYDGNGRAGAKVEKHTLPAVFIDVPSHVTVPQAVLSPMAARELGLAPATVGMYVTGSTITADQERNADEAVAAIVPYAGLYVERGYQGDDATRILLLILGSLGAVLMLGGTLTTTYLALSDARPDLATLGAVGAAPRTRRAVAGSFAVVVALVGGVVGAAVGFIPGIAVARPLTSSQGVYTAPSGGSGSSGFNADQLPVTGPFLDIPWLLIVALVVALPLVTALVVAATTRPRLPLVARLD